jgi:hypothetical protein
MVWVRPLFCRFPEVKKPPSSSDSNSRVRFPINRFVKGGRKCERDKGRGKCGGRFKEGCRGTENRGPVPGSPDGGGKVGSESRRSIKVKGAGKVECGRAGDGGHMAGPRTLTLSSPMGLLVSKSQTSFPIKLTHRDHVDDQPSVRVRAC